MEQKKVEPERLVGLPANACGLLVDLFGAHTMAAERAEAARVGPGRNEVPAGSRSHPAQGDRMLDPQQLADWCTYHSRPPNVCATEIARENPLSPSQRPDANAPRLDHNQVSRKLVGVRRDDA